MLIEFLETCDDEEERIKILSKLKPVVNHLNTIFDELVESLQIKQDSEIDVTPVDLKKTIATILMVFETQINQCKATINVDLEEAIVPYSQKYADSILTNLVSNALKYKSPNRPLTLHIKTYNDDKGLVLAVADNGLGIDLNRHKNSMFKIRKVFHVHPDSRGFGLFITKTQVDAMGGEIWVESVPDVGSTFYIRLKSNTI